MIFNLVELSTDWLVTELNSLQSQLVEKLSSKEFSQEISARLKVI